MKVDGSPRRVRTWRRSGYMDGVAEREDLRERGRGHVVVPCSYGPKSGFRRSKRRKYNKSICQDGGEGGNDDKMLSSLFVKSQRNAACDLIARVPVRLNDPAATMPSVRRESLTTLPRDVLPASAAAHSRPLRLPGHSCPSWPPAYSTPAPSATATPPPLSPDLVPFLRPRARTRGNKLLSNILRQPPIIRGGIPRNLRFRFRLPGCAYPWPWAMGHAHWLVVHTRQRAASPSPALPLSNLPGSARSLARMSTSAPSPRGLCQ